MAVIMLSTVFLTEAAYSEDYSRYPEKGRITLIDLGAGSCIPCKMMTPILEKVKKSFAGKAEVIVIDLRYDRDQAPRFQVRAIPTQVFFDREGKEVYRHVGFMDENAIVEQFAKMGVK
ncbi:MAG: thioredoxin family protein [Desulfobacterota bacterium]|nr:thioredoxin family protein [Thermodesulfobacteriota bacterium]